MMVSSLLHVLRNPQDEGEHEEEKDASIGWQTRQEAAHGDDADGWCLADVMWEKG